jgi:hypothetical protein
MPVAFNREYDKDRDPWNKWYRRHYLSLADGKWLCDRRDPCPAKRRSWTRISKEDNWLWRVSKDDFYEVLTIGDLKPPVICVAGYWRDHREDFVESISISSALVSPATGDALANALRQSHPNDFRLPNYKEDSYEVKTSPFELNGWITSDEGSGDRLDSFDPYSCGINVPYRRIGQSFAALLNLSADSDGRGWRVPDSDLLAISSTIWSTKDSDHRDKPYRYGERLVASVDMLKLLCNKTGKDLVFEVQIERKRHRGQYSSRSDDDIYSPPSHKIFIFSSNGYLRDTAKRHKVG